MRLDEVPPGPVYVDTNVWYMYLRSDRQYLTVVRSFLERVVKGEIVALVGVPVLDELFYRLLLARIREQEGQHPLTGLRQDPAGLVRRHAPPIRKAIEIYFVCLTCIWSVWKRRMHIVSCTTPPDTDCCLETLSTSPSWSA
jgi:predicted nucleic acid-binding protein